MLGFNKVILIGNLTRDPELRYTPSGTPVVNFPLAVNRRYRQADEQKEEVCYVDIVVFGRQAEHCGHISIRVMERSLMVVSSNDVGKQTMGKSEVSMRWSLKP